ncbi:HTH domain-containing protein [Leptolyngbya sp. 'hensonii']|uniref:HTH domain-containing protein n=1 Tax=Leptolyngbya sp. 'hensonii' TaxID=1922337 RepID=UPI000A74B831|nr:HTH domain-containing protein [Leptolyngbya sp. 'hensonii']
MSRHLERLLEIDALLRKESRQTAPSLAEELEVSERIICSEITFLRDRYHFGCDCAEAIRVGAVIARRS